MEIVIWDRLASRWRHIGHWGHVENEAICGLRLCDDRNQIVVQLLCIDLFAIVDVVCLADLVLDMVTSCKVDELDDDYPKLRHCINPSQVER